MPANHFMISRGEGGGSGGGVIVGCEGVLSVARAIVGYEGYCRW